MWQIRDAGKVPTLGIAGLLALIAGCTARPVAIRVSPDPEPLARAVADRVLVDFPEPPPFDWGEGVLMAGMMHAGIAFDEPRYIAFVQRWADHWNAKDLATILPGGPTPEIQKYCGHWGPGYPVILLYERTKNPQYLTMARQVADFISQDATRTSEGGLGHWGGNQQLWVDTLYMVGPLFAQLTRLTGEKAYLAEAVRQMDIYVSHTQDTGTGLFWHMYDDPGKQRQGVQWARGCGWVAMTYVELLRQLDPGSKDYQRLLAQYHRLIDGLLKVQDPVTGFWHTVLDAPETYLETSASAMILNSIVQARRFGLLDRPGPADIEKIWKSLAGKVNKEGHVVDVSGGTIPADKATYAEKIKGTYTWGTGAFLMAAGTMHTCARGNEHDRH